MPAIFSRGLQMKRKQGSIQKRAKYVWRDQDGYGLFLEFETEPSNVKELEAALENLKQQDKLYEYRLEPTAKYYGVSFYTKEGVSKKEGVDAAILEAAEIVDQYFSTPQD